jgi:CRISPR/Cas system-associated exonuclease Cas4 (RecB family)
MFLQKEEGLKEFGKKLTEEQKKETFEIFEIYLSQYLAAQEKGLASKVLAVEDEFYVDLDGKMLLQGVIDRIEVDADLIRKCTDYKTSKEMDFLAKDDFQLMTYCFVDALRNPEEQVFRGSYVMLKHQCQTINFQYTRDQVMKVGEKFLAYAEEIQKEKLFRPTTTPLCYFCDYNSQKLCPEGFQMTQIIERRKKEKEMREKLKANKSVFGASGW